MPTEELDQLVDADVASPQLEELQAWKVELQNREGNRAGVSLEIV